MNKHITQIYNKFDALLQREKLMVGCLFVVLLYIAWQILLFDESTVAYIKNANLIKVQQQKNSSMKLEITAYKERAINNPNIKLRKERKQYQTTILKLDAKLNKKMKGLINPKKMTSMLKDIFKSNTKLTLLSMVKLKTESIFDFSGDGTDVSEEEILLTSNISDETIADDKESTAVVYRHPVQIVFNGSYLNVMSYLEVIESMPWDLYWENVQLDVEKYPQARIVITVFTLSLKKGWVGV